MGATLSTDEVAAFDAAHAALLARIAPESFTVLHRIDAHVLAFKDGARQHKKRGYEFIRSLIWHKC